MASIRRRITTVGHSDHAPERFLMLLVQHGVEGVVDIRSVPYSRRAPQFDQRNLRLMLKNVGIRYGFLGKELGGRPSDPHLYDVDRRVQYDRVLATAEFRSGIERVIRAANQISVTLLCTEREPLECHRTLLVGHALAKRGWDVHHILGNGELEKHADAMSRLLRLHGIASGHDLFRSHSEVIDQALDRQARKFAYVAPDRFRADIVDYFEDR